MKLSKIILSLLAVSPLMVFAQFSKPDVKLSANEKYIYPIHPGQPGSLAGTMGELRSTHFHSGIDIRTNNMIGFPVVASKSGYISRITRTPSGYGNIIYITHPDGNTTLYAHLDKFKGALAEHILQEHYKRKSSELDLYFQKDQFPVKQGDTIALSGNTGSSSGPHLHFDIRDSSNYALDPLQVADFPEVPDRLPPAPEKIALKTLDIHSRINDRFGRVEFHAIRSGNNYTIASPILASGLIGVEIIAKDKLAPNSPFYGGVNYIEVRVDNDLIFSQAIEKIDITETRAIYTLMDFKTMRNKGTKFYKLYIDDGNQLKFYENSPSSGKIKVNPDKESLVQITMRDSYSNTSNVSFMIKPSPIVKDVMNLEPMTTDSFLDITENTLMVAVKPCADTTRKTQVYKNGEVKEIKPDYASNKRAVYLFDLRKSIPDSIVTCGKTLRPGITQTIPSGTNYKFYTNRMEIEFPDQSLYDTLYLKSNYWMNNGIEVFSIGERTTPLHKSISVALNPVQTYQWNQSMGVYRIVGKGYAYIGGELVNGRIRFNTREFGAFTILQDPTPPTIKVVYADRSGVSFKIKDNLSGIASYEATINGQWLLMHYDSKSATISSERLNKKIPLSGNFELVVTDNAGNKNTFTKKII